MLVKCSQVVICHGCNENAKASRIRESMLELDNVVIACDLPKYVNLLLHSCFHSFPITPVGRKNLHSHNVPFHFIYYFLYPCAGSMSKHFVGAKTVFSRIYLLF